jgi:hypothetical protein
MSTHSAHLKSGGALRRTLVVAAAILCVGVVTPTAQGGRSDAPAGGYGWPIKPFHEQHPVRGFFGDPRIGETPDGISRQFHFGVDVSAPNGAPVYATMTGAIRIHDLHRDVVLIDGPGGVEFSYWHIVPTVRTGDRAVAYRTMIGRVERPWAHVHFSEMRNGVYLNPLRPGAMGPYVDTTKPTVAAVQLERDGRPVRLAAAGGALDLIAEVSDTTPLAAPAPWNDLPVMPALVRWRLRGPKGFATGWTTAVDFRETIPPANAFQSIFARWTRQNHAHRPGRYRIYLTRGWQTEALSRSKYIVEVAASDTRGNTTIATFPLTLKGRS